MDASVKATLSALLDQVREQQVELGRLSRELFAVTETLKEQKTGFQGAYEMQLLSSDVSDMKRDADARIELIDVAIQTLQESGTEN